MHPSSGPPESGEALRPRLPAALRGRDPYLILGVAPTSSRELLERAYAAQVIACQQQHASSPHGAEHLAAVEAAFALVATRQQRALYDRQPLLAWRRLEVALTSAGGGGLVTARGRGPEQARQRKPSCAAPMPWWSKVLALAGGPITPTDIDTGTDAYHLHMTAGLSCAEFADGSMLEQAANEFGRALAVRPGGVEAAYDLGLVRYRQGQFKEARRCFAELVRQQPAGDPSHHVLELLQPWC
jgi:tetratricopeptide (TPR) repeat protein